MCNLSQGVARRGAERKVVEPVPQNLKQGKKPEEIAEWLGLTVEQVCGAEQKALAPA